MAWAAVTPEDVDADADEDAEEDADELALADVLLGAVVLLELLLEEQAASSAAAVRAAAGAAMRFHVRVMLDIPPMERSRTISVTVSFFTLDRRSGGEVLDFHNQAVNKVIMGVLVLVEPERNSVLSGYGWEPAESTSKVTAQSADLLASRF